MSAVTAELAGPPVSPPAAGRADLHVAATCRDCGQPVTRVRTRVPGEWVTLDGKDPAGAWWAVKIAGQWRMMRPEPGEDPPAAGVRYREHGCQEAAERAAEAVTAVLEAVRAPIAMLTGSMHSSMGPCGGGCGAATRRHGLYAEPLCRDCSAVLEAWRESPGPYRGPVLYGKVVDGSYQHRST